MSTVCILTEWSEGSSIPSDTSAYASRVDAVKAAEAICLARNVPVEARTSRYSPGTLASIQWSSTVSGLYCHIGQVIVSLKEYPIH